MEVRPSEDLLHFIWQYQKIATIEPMLFDGSTLQVLKPGLLNSNAGPDFSDAQIVIDTITWVGNIEVHILSSDWIKHKHSNKFYQEVILHVVWENDQPIVRPNGETIPCLELKNLVNTSLLAQYQQLMTSKLPIACASDFAQVPLLSKHMMLDKLSIGRIERKANDFLELLADYATDWAQTSYHWFLKYMGFKVNAFGMELLAKQLPLKTIQKLTTEESVIAVLLGQAGFLQNCESEYAQNLQKEYQYQKQKHTLTPELELDIWNYSRLRPANFPEVRLATMGQLLFKQRDLFSVFLEKASNKDISEIFKLPRHDFWNNHYTLKQIAQGTSHSFGKASIELLLINVVAPMVAAYGIHNQNYNYVEQACAITEGCAAEKNAIISIWNNQGLEVQNAADSQAAIEWYTNYCQKKKCLQCQVAFSLLQ
jgi:hypothetical protein